MEIEGLSAPGCVCDSVAVRIWDKYGILQFSAPRSKNNSERGWFLVYQEQPGIDKDKEHIGPMKVDGFTRCVIRGAIHLRLRGANIPELRVLDD